jgi:hypothetical protein
LKNVLIEEYGSRRKNDVIEELIDKYQEEREII